MKLTSAHVAFFAVGLIGGLMLGDFGPLFHKHDPRIAQLSAERDSLKRKAAADSVAFRNQLLAAQQATDFFRGMAQARRHGVRTLTDSVIVLVHDTTRSADSVLAELRPMVIALRDSIEILEAAHDSAFAAQGRQVAILTARVTQVEDLNVELDRRLGEALTGWKKASRRCRIGGAGPFTVNQHGAGIGAAVGISCGF